MKTRYCNLCKRDVATKKLSPTGIVIGLAFLIISAFHPIGFLIGLLIFGIFFAAAKDKCSLCGTTDLEFPKRLHKPIYNYLGKIEDGGDGRPQLRETEHHHE